MDDFIPGETIVHFFNSQKASDGSKLTMAGSPAAVVYKGTDTTETSTGPSLTIDFDSRTGLHALSIDTSDAFYVANKIYSVVLSAGTVDSTSVVGSVIYMFSLGMKTNAIRRNTAQSGGNNTITLDASASATNDYYNTCSVLITGGAGIGQQRRIIDYDGTSKVATLSRNWAINPDNTSIFLIIPGNDVDVGAVNGTAQTAGDIMATANDIHSDLGIVAGYIDTEVAAILADTNELQTDLTNGGRLDLLIDAIKAKTDSLSFTGSLIQADVVDWKGSAAPANTGDAYAIVSNGTYGNSNLKALIDAIDALIDDIKAKTDMMPAVWYTSS